MNNASNSSSDNEEDFFNNAVTSAADNSPIPLFANVRFEDQKEKIYQVPIEDIRQKIVGKDGKAFRILFEPTNLHDFDPKVLYRVKWYCPPNCDDQHENHFEFYPAMITHLGYSKDDLKNEAASKRLKFNTNISDITGDTNSTLKNDNEDSHMDDISIKELKKIAAKTAAKSIINKNEKFTELINKRKRLDTNIEKLRKGTKPTILSEEVIKPSMSEAYNLNDLNQQKIPTPEISSPRAPDFDELSIGSKLNNSSDHRNEKQDFIAAFNLARSAHKDVENSEENSSQSQSNLNNNKRIRLDVYERINSAENQVDQSGHSEKSIQNNMADEPPEMENPPRVLPDAVLVSHGRRPQKVEFTLPPDPVNLTPHGEMYSEVNDGNQIYLGLDVYVDVDVWKRMMTKKKKKPSIFLRELAEVIWTPSVLIMRAFDVSLCSAQTPGIEGHRVPFEEDKWQLLIALYTNYLNELKEKNANLDIHTYLSTVNDTVGQKIQDLRASLRRQKEEKELGIVRKKKRAKKSTVYIKHHGKPSNGEDDNT